jgi:hypothetical protein
MCTSERPPPRPRCLQEDAYSAERLTLENGTELGFFGIFDGGGRRELQAARRRCSAAPRNAVICMPH